MTDTLPVLVRPWLAGVRTLLRVAPAVVAIAGEHTYVGGRPHSAPLPAVVVHRVGGGMRGETYEAALVQAEAWAGDGAQAEALIAAVVAHLGSLRPMTPLAFGVQLMGCSLNSLVWVPDPVTATPRYIATLDVSVRALF